MARPRSMVSSEEWVTYSALATAALGIEMLIGAGDSANQIGSHQRSFAEIRICDVSCEAVEKDSEGENARPIGCTELRRESGENAGENVARACCAHTGITGGVDVGVACRRGD